VRESLGTLSRGSRLTAKSLGPMRFVAAPGRWSGLVILPSVGKPDKIKFARRNLPRFASLKQRSVRSATKGTRRSRFGNWRTIGRLPGTNICILKYVRTVILSELQRPAGAAI
jgi:hypothetical protein